MNPASLQAPSPRLEALPPGLFTLADHEALAARTLEPAAWAYLTGGAADEITLRANRSAWDAINLAPRVLRPPVGGHTRIRLLGREHPHPILLAPVAWQRLAHPDGELASAAAAAALGAGLVLSTQSSMPMETVARQFEPGGPDRGPLWFQLYWQAERQTNLQLLQRAHALGFQAAVLTVDAPAHGARDRERRAGFRLPPCINAPTLADLPSPPAPAPGAHPVFDHLLALAPDWDDLAWLLAHSPMPLLLKGVLHPDDARQAQRMGVAGLIVSNHGGRVLDTTPASAQALPLIADAVGPELLLLVDGGIRRGTDILKALALGAHAVLVGRPVVHALACAGAQGVAHMLRLLLDELHIAMALTGCNLPARATRSLLWPPVQTALEAPSSE